MSARQGSTYSQGIRSAPSAAALLLASGVLLISFALFLWPSAARLSSCQIAPGCRAFAWQAFVSCIKMVRVYL